MPYTKKSSKKQKKNKQRKRKPRKRGKPTSTLDSHFMFFVKLIIAALIDFGAVCLVFSIPSIHKHNLISLIVIGVLVINYITLIKCFKWKEYQQVLYWVLAYTADITITLSIIIIYAGGLLR